jgi:hypothetical protein
MKRNTFHTFRAAVCLAVVAFPCSTSLAQDATTAGLIAAGKQFSGAMVERSTPSPLLMQMAAMHAKHMADGLHQGHCQFDARFQVVASRLGMGASEIVAESWAWQANDSMRDLGWEMFKCWRQSSGHWQVASRQHKFWGGAMAQGSDGRWFACIIVAD